MDSHENGWSSLASVDLQNPSSSVCFQDKIPPWGGNAGRIRAEHDRATETWKSEGSDKMEEESQGLSESIVFV